MHESKVEVDGPDPGPAEIVQGHRAQELNRRRGSPGT
jgi:hypothetical protein